ESNGARGGAWPCAAWWCSARRGASCASGMRVSTRSATASRVSVLPTTIAARPRYRVQRRQVSRAATRPSASPKTARNSTWRATGALSSMPAQRASIGVAIARAARASPAATRSCSRSNWYPGGFDRIVALLAANRPAGPAPRACADGCRRDGERCRKRARARAFRVAARRRALPERDERLSQLDGPLSNHRLGQPQAERRPCHENDEASEKQCNVRPHSSHDLVHRCLGDGLDRKEVHAYRWRNHRKLEIDH